MRSVNRKGKEEGVGGLVRRPTLWDVALFVALFVLVFTIPGIIRGEKGDGTTLEVRTQAGVATFSLLEDGVHTLSGPLGEAKLTVRGGKARLENSPCPLKIGEAMGPVSKPGDVILCIPNRISIRVTGKVAVDAVSR